MSLIYGQDERLLPWACDKIGIYRFRNDARAIGREVNSELVGVVVWDGFSECDCNMHVASNGAGNWLSRELLVHAFAYPFLQLEYRRVTAPVASRNQAAIRFNQHLGFEIEGVCKDGTPDDDLIIMGMTRANCRFIPPQERRHHG